MTDDTPAHGCTIDGQPAMPILISEYQRLVTQADPELHARLTAAIEALGKSETELAALRQVSRGYCPACGRGDAAPTVADWEQQRQRAERAEAAIERARDFCSPERNTDGLGYLRSSLDVLGVLDGPGPQETDTTQPARCTCTGTSAGLNACARCPTPWPDTPGATRIRHDNEPAITLPTVPREHCGHLSPETLLTSPRTECVLRPGHQGSHADDRGCRWWPIASADPAEQRADRAVALLHDILYAPHITGDRITAWRSTLDQLTDKEH